MRLTLGQQKIRYIVNDMAGSYRVNMEYKYDSPFWNSFEQKIRGDYKIKDDEITGRILSHPGFSKFYIRWIQANSIKKEYRDSYPTGISLNNFDYNRCFSSPAPAYMGGDKYDTTYRCLFSLHNGDRLSSDGWGLLYIEGVGYSTIIGGGNHRSLACMLGGYREINPSYLYVYQPKISLDNGINKAFIELASICPNLITEAMQESPSDLEIEIAKSIAFDTSGYEKRIMKEYFRQNVRPHLFPSYSPGTKVTEVYDLYVMVKDVLRERSLVMNSRLYRWRRKLFPQEVEYRYRNIEEIISRLYLSDQEI